MFYKNNIRNINKKAIISKLIGLYNNDTYIPFMEI